MDDQGDKQVSLEAESASPPPLPWLDRRAMNGMKILKKLGEGRQATVCLIAFNGRQAVWKRSKNANYLPIVERETKVLQALAGAGGAPILLGV